LINPKTSGSDETNVSEVWSAAIATLYEVLIGMCASLVAMNWEKFRTSRLFHVIAEIEGMMSLTGCPRMAEVDMVSLPEIQDAPDIITDLFVEGIDIPV
uniref:Protein kinase domain-containing protein n=1 Tax=Hymenolepis diminuta TaxID=6216 RepID=A0A158QGD7_HYMDI